MISHSYTSQGTPQLLTSIRKLVTYMLFHNDSNGLESLSIATVSKTKTISKTSRVPVMYISNPAYKNPSTLLKHCSAYA